MVNKVKAIYPNWVYVDGDHSPEKATQFDKVIACFIAYKHIGHPLWASMMAAARSYDVPIFYVQYTNMERMLLDMRRSYAAIAQFRADEGIDDSDVVPASPEERGERKKAFGRNRRKLAELPRRNPKSSENVRKPANSVRPLRRNWKSKPVLRRLREKNGSAGLRNGRNVLKNSGSVRLKPESANASGKRNRHVRPQNSS